MAGKRNGGALQRRGDGFTLVEIVVVLVIIAILSAIAVPTMLGFVRGAKESEAYAHLRTVRVSLALIETQAQTDDTFYENASVSMNYPNLVDKQPDVYLEQKLEKLLPDGEALSHTEVAVTWEDDAITQERITYYLGEGRTGARLVYENGEITKIDG